MPKYLKIPMDMPVDEHFIVRGVNAKGNTVYLTKYTGGIFVWLEVYPCDAHGFTNSAVARLASEECEIPSYNQPAEDAIEIIRHSKIDKTDWDNTIAAIVNKYLDFIEVIEEP